MNLISTNKPRKVDRLVGSIHRIVWNLLSCNTE